VAHLYNTLYREGKESQYTYEVKVVFEVKAYGRMFVLFLEGERD